VFIFDTDHLSILQRDSDQTANRLQSSLSAHNETNFWVTVVSFHEQFLGWHNYLARATKPDDLVFGYSRFEQVLEAFTNYQILPFDNAAVDVFVGLRKQRLRVGTMDLRIASIAIATGMTLLTRNTVDFERIPGLTFEDWT
jgi:tRNA(fMet)-specific endonuclease VapC